MAPERRELKGLLNLCEAAFNEPLLANPILGPPSFSPHAHLVFEALLGRSARPIKELFSSDDVAPESAALRLETASAYLHVMLTTPMALAFASAVSSSARSEMHQHYDAWIAELKRCNAMDKLCGMGFPSTNPTADVLFNLLNHTACCCTAFLCGTDTWQLELGHLLARVLDCKSAKTLLLIQFMWGSVSPAVNLWLVCSLHGMWSSLPPVHMDVAVRSSCCSGWSFTDLYTMDCIHCVSRKLKLHALCIVTEKRTQDAACDFAELVLAFECAMPLGDGVLPPLLQPGRITTSRPIMEAVAHLALRCVEHVSCGRLDLPCFHSCIIMLAAAADKLALYGSAAVDLFMGPGHVARLGSLMSREQDAELKRLCNSRLRAIREIIGF